MFAWEELFRAAKLNNEQTRKLGLHTPVIKGAGRQDVTDL
jgi:hypothetical protein